jgi:hypothetical protein
MADEQGMTQKKNAQTGSGRWFWTISIRRCGSAALILFLLAGICNLWLGPLAEQLPGNYANETEHLDQVRSRETVNGEWQASTLIVKRTDQTITSSATVNLIEGGVHSYSAPDVASFEVSGLYGVDRTTRQNLPGYGDVERSGHYLFPPHVQPGSYTIWNPIFIGPLRASFVRSDTVEGLPVYVFQFSATGLDETAGYSYLSGVPNHYHALTDGQGTAWVEPVSGIVVDYEDSGTSYFAEPATRARIADFNQWTERFTPVTIAAQLKLAQAARLQALFLEIWLPGGLTAAGLACLGWAGVTFLRRRPEKQAYPGTPG